MRDVIASFLLSSIDIPDLWASRGIGQKNYSANKNFHPFVYDFLDQLADR